MKRYSTIIWDMDGTLMDTLIDLKEAVNHALVLNGMPARSYEEVRNFVGNGVLTLMKRAVPAGTDDTLFEKVFADFKAYYILHCQDNTCIYKGMPEAIKALKEMGCRMAVVSNKLQAGVTELYESEMRVAESTEPFCMKDFIDVAIGEREGMERKPAPDMVNLALKALGTSKEEAVYVGDSEVDVATAKNSQLPCISVLWGFRDQGWLEAHGANTFAETPDDVVRIVANDAPQQDVRMD